MLFILKQYTQEGMQITEYTIDGTTVSHTVKTPIQTEPIEPEEPEPTLKEIQDTQMAIMSGIFDIYVTQLEL